jgi:RNA polymerase sigma-70 factor (ECF subfamily)
MPDGNAHDDASRFMLLRVSPDAGQRVPSAAHSPVAVEGLSFDAFLEGISARAFRFAELGLRHREDALDAVQDAMIRMMGYRERPAEEWTPLFWSILRSRIVDLQRRGLFRMRWLVPSRTPREGEDEIDWSDQAVDTDPDPSGRHDQRETWSALASALRALPARQREAFTLRVLEDCDVATTARIMGCSEGSVKTHLSRARESLQKQLEDFR